jgi:hypothetical protein
MKSINIKLVLHWLREAVFGMDLYAEVPIGELRMKRQSLADYAARVQMRLEEAESEFISEKLKNTPLPIPMYAQHLSHSFESFDAKHVIVRAVR